MTNLKTFCINDCIINIESNDELKINDIKYRTCNYFNDTNKIEDIDFDNNLLNEKSYGNILIYNISYKTWVGVKPFCIRFDKIDGFFRVYDETRYLVLFGPEEHNAIYNRIRYLISQESDVTYIFSHKYVRIKIYSYDFLPLEKTLTLHNVIIL